MQCSYSRWLMPLSAVLCSMHSAFGRMRGSGLNLGVAACFVLSVDAYRSPRWSGNHNQPSCRHQLSQHKLCSGYTGHSYRNPGH
jgi:hypothetical protein